MGGLQEIAWAALSFVAALAIGAAVSQFFL